MLIQFSELMLVSRFIHRECRIVFQNVVTGA